MNYDQLPLDTQLRMKIDECLVDKNNWAFSRNDLTEQHDELRARTLATA